jgi:hypothetical protein
MDLEHVRCLTTAEYRTELAVIYVIKVLNKVVFWLSYRILNYYIYYIVLNRPTEAEDPLWRMSKVFGNCNQK